MSDRLKARATGAWAPSRGRETWRKADSTPRIERNARPHQSISGDWDSRPIDALWRLFIDERGTPQTTIEAIMLTVRAPGVAALKEPANLERLSRSDSAAKWLFNILAEWSRARE